MLILMRIYFLRCIYLKELQRARERQREIYVPIWDAGIAGSGLTQQRPQFLLCKIVVGHS